MEISIRIVICDISNLAKIERMENMRPNHSAEKLECLWMSAEN